MKYQKKTGGGGGNRTRVRESSALGSTCLARSIVFNLPMPDGQGNRSAIPLGFSGSGPDFRHRDPAYVDPWNLTAQARISQRLA